MRRWILLLLCLASCGEDEAPTAPETLPVDVSPEIVQWLQNHAVPFVTPEAGSGFEDLARFGEMVGDTKVVALGEATHGTREFFQMKHRILEFLVEEKGFTDFAIEATWPESRAINEYIHTGVGDPGDLLAGLYFWTWNTEEVLDMIRWMREKRVSFHGFDMQFPKRAMDQVVAYVVQVDSASARLAEELYGCYRPYELAQQDYARIPEAEQEECSSNVESVFWLLTTHRDAYEALSGPEAFAVALQSARIVWQSEEYYSSRNSNPWVLRDAAMAENVKWIVGQAGPQAKVVLWAHNEHVGSNSRFGGSMGQHLRQFFGADMLVVGFSFYAGRFNARPASLGPAVPHEVEPPPANSYSYHFRGADLPRMILDLRNIEFSNPGANWLLGPLYFRLIGAVYDKSLFYYSQVVLPDEYDAVIYFQDTTPSRLLPFATEGGLSATRQVEQRASIERP